MKRTAFKIERIEISDQVEFQGEFYHDTGEVAEINSSKKYPNNRLIFVRWDHDETLNPMEGIYGAVPERDLRKIQKS